MRRKNLNITNNLIDNSSYKIRMITDALLEGTYTSLYNEEFLSIFTDILEDVKNDYDEIPCDEKKEFFEHFKSILKRFLLQFEKNIVEENESIRICSNYLEMVIESITNNNLNEYFYQYPILKEKTVYIKKFNEGTNLFDAVKCPAQIFKDYI